MTTRTCEEAVRRLLTAATFLSASMAATGEAAVYPPTGAAAFVCDRPAERLWSQELNGRPMPATIGVALDSSSTAATAASAVAGYRQVRVRSGTPLAALNAAIDAPSEEVREFYFDAEKYAFGGTILVTRPVKLIGTSTRATGVSRSGQRTRILGGNGADLHAAIQGSGGMANDVEIRYLTVERFGRDPNGARGLSPLPPDARWAIDSRDHHGWIVTNNRIVDNEVAGLRAGSKALVRNNCFESNGRYGMSELRAFDLVVIQNEFVDNGSAWSGSERPDRGDHGAMKIFASRTVNMRENWVHDNVGRGIWFDTNNSDVRIERNTIERNLGHGLMYETSYNALIVGNVVSGNNVTASAEGYPGTPTDAGIFISNSGGADLVGGADRRAIGGRLADNTLRVSGNFVAGNKYGITLFQNAKQFCGSDDESSRGWCTLTGGRREVSSSRLVRFEDARAIGAPDLSSPWNSRRYTSCMYLPYGGRTVASPEPDDLRKACFWNTTSVIVSGNSMVVDAAAPQRALIFQQATDACPYPECDFRTQDPAKPDQRGRFRARSNPFTSPSNDRNTFFLDTMIESNSVSGTRWLGNGGAPACPANVSNSGTRGVGSEQFCSAWF